LPAIGVHPSIAPNKPWEGNRRQRPCLKSEPRAAVPPHLRSVKNMTMFATPPDTNLGELRALIESRNRWFWAFWISGILMILPPLAGIAGVVASMLGGFSRLAHTGQGDPAGLARDISTGMLATMVGIVLSIVAFIAFVVCLVVFVMKNRTLRALQTPNPPNKAQ